MRARQCLIYGVLAAARMLFWCDAALATDKAPPPPNNQLEGVRLDQRLDESIPLDATFMDEQGDEVQLSKFFDGRRPVILTLVYFKCPMLCTLVLNDTLRAIRAMSGPELGPDYQIVTVSFNPREGPDLAAPKKDHYVTEYCRGLHFKRTDAESGWHFLTGTQASIHQLTEAVGFHYRWDEKFQQYAHPSGIIVLTPDGKIARYFFGIGYEPNDLRLSLVEASNNQIGGLTEQILLGCFHYDASKGKYSFAVMNAIKVGGVLILLALGVLMRAMTRHNRRKWARINAEAAALAANDD